MFSFECLDDVDYMTPLGQEGCDGPNPNRGLLVELTGSRWGEGENWLRLLTQMENLDVKALFGY